MVRTQGRFDPEAMVWTTLPPASMTRIVAEFGGAAHTTVLPVTPTRGQIMGQRLRPFAMPLLAAVAAVAALTAVTAPAASAASYRQVYAQLFYGDPSVTVPQCTAAGTADVAAGRFDFYRCVTFTAGADPSEELEGFLILG
jgi:hypothetical protein